MATHTINLPCIKDTWIDATNPNTSHGSDTTLIGGFVSLGEVAGEVSILLQFDWSLLPARKRITGLKLKFFNVNDLINADYCNFTIDYMSRVWDETATWNTLLGSSVTGGTVYLKNINVAGGQYFEITLLVASIMYQNRLIDYGMHVQWYKVIGSSVQPSYVTIHSRENTYPPILIVTYEDVPPSAPTPTDPIGAYKDNKSIIHFAWTYNSDVGGTQKAFDLQWSTDQTNWTAISETTANNYYDMPADTLPAGNIYWRVRCYNEYDEVGPYSDIQSFYSIGAPAAPALNPIPANTARPVVTWAAFSQQVYQLQVLSNDMIIYDSGIVPGINIRQHKIKAWLDDGKYTIRLRIKNEYDLWSEWGSAAVTISTDKPAKPTLTAERTQYGIKLTSDIDALIYRDGICIGKAESEYNDNAVVNGKEYSYMARAVRFNDRAILHNLAVNGSFENGGTGFAFDPVYTKSDEQKLYGDYSFKGVGVGAGYYLILRPHLIAGHKYYARCSVYLSSYTSGTPQFVVLDASAAGTTKNIKTTTLSTWQTMSGVVTAGVSGNAFNIGIVGTGVLTLYADGFSYIDLTTSFGAGNEPTLEQMDAIMDSVGGWFEGTIQTSIAIPEIETYADSDKIKETADIKNALIAPVSDLSDVFTFSRSLNTPPKRTYNRQPGGAYVEYAGRTHLVWEPTEHISAGWSMAFFLKTWAEVETFINLYDRKETVLYRDARGRKTYGILSNLSVNDERFGYMVSFTITEVDHNEEVEA